jgi:hypothetical protein
MAVVVSNETGPTWFVFDSTSGVEFKKGDGVEFVPKAGGAAVLTARVLDTKTTDFGAPPRRCLQLSLAIDGGDLEGFKKEGSFGAYAVQALNSTARAGVHPGCKVKYAAHLLKDFELQKMFDKAELLIKTAAEGHNDDFAKKWFGTIATSKGKELEKIHERCAELHQGVEGLSKVVFEVVGGEFLGGIDPKVKGQLKGGGTCRIQLGRGFAYTRYSWGEKVATIVHELTHWLLGTVDAKLGVDDAYGAKAIALSKDAKECGKALNNADNWAFYICEYRGAAGTEDWRFFSEPEMKLRGPFSQDPKNTDMLLIA